MSDFTLESIGEALAGGGLSAIGKRIRVKQGDIANILSNGIPSMLAGMQSNVSTEEGAKSLARALKQHSKDDFSDISAFLKGADLKDGKKILGHVFGDNQEEVIQKISEAGGVTRAKTTSILSLFAPLLLSMLGNQQNQQQQNSGFSLGGLLGGLLGGGQSQSSSSGGLLGGLGGSLGTSLLGSMLGGSSVQEANDADTNGGLLSGLLNLFH